MWEGCLVASVVCLVLSVVVSAAVHHSHFGKVHRFNILNALLVGVFVSAVLMFYPVHSVTVETGVRGVVGTLLLCVFNAMQIFALGCEFSIVRDSLFSCPDALNMIYQVWAGVLFVVAPVLTFGFVLSLFKNLVAYVKYLAAFFRDAYVFSELNERSVALASDLKRKHPRAAIIFTDVYEESEACALELLEEARLLHAICFKKDLLAVRFARHSTKRRLSFFTVGCSASHNLDQALTLIDRYRNRCDTDLYVFSTLDECEVLLSSVDKGVMRVRRVHEVQSLIHRVLYEDGARIFRTARESEDGMRHVGAVVVGMGAHGTEMVKSLAWFGQMDGYTLSIDAFDADPLAIERLLADAPELMSEAHNGRHVEGEAEYTIRLHAGVRAESACFAETIRAMSTTTYVFISLGNDDLNVSTALRLRTYFERMGIHPVIQTVVGTARRRTALERVTNFKGQPYGIECVGDVESSFTEDVILDSALEAEALARHLKWGKEEDFWRYGYNYRSSVAAALHMRARIACGIAGAEKTEEELTAEERRSLELLEHRRWNAYMRTEGYVYSGSTDPKSRNDLGKMHHDLIPYDTLSEEEKRKDSRVGTK